MPWISKGFFQFQTKERGIISLKAGDVVPDDVVIGANIGLWCDYRVDEPEAEVIAETPVVVKPEKVVVAKTPRRRRATPKVEEIVEEEVVEETPEPAVEDDLTIEDEDLDEILG
jgi:hypothetical protein